MVISSFGYITSEPFNPASFRGGFSQFPPLRRGDKGPEVQDLQNLLILAGFSVGKAGADGTFGANTESAVVAFKNAKKIPYSRSDIGVATEAVWEALTPVEEKKPSGRETIAMEPMEIVGKVLKSNVLPFVLVGAAGLLALGLLLYSKGAPRVALAGYRRRKRSRK